MNNSITNNQGNFEQGRFTQQHVNIHHHAVLTHNNKTLTMEKLGILG
jgi:hypothetical protein